jgi:hypothetical protein
MYINDNAVININYGRLQDLILVFKIPMGTRKYFFEISRKFLARALLKVHQPRYVRSERLFISQDSGMENENNVGDTQASSARASLIGK